MMLHKYLARLLLLSLVAAFSSFSLADEEEPTTLREIFLRAETQLQKNNLSAYEKLRDQLDTYPLLPYLEQQKYLNNLQLKDEPAINDFLTRYRSTPLDWNLRKAWLKYLIKQQQPDLFLRYYQPSGSAYLTCYYHRYRLQSGVSAKKVLAEVKKLWQVGRSQPKACDPLFKQWHKAGYLTNQLVWQRIKLAAKGGQHQLIPYLARFLPKKQRYLADLWHQVHRNPGHINLLSRFPKKSSAETEIMVYGLERLIWRDADQAIQTYEKARILFKFSDSQQQTIREKFALALANKKHPAAHFWFDQLDSRQLTDDLMHWYLVDALRQQNWGVIRNKLDALSKQQKTSLQWRYWYARSLLELNQREAGRKMMTSLARHRHYYGFLAASQINQAVHLENAPLQFPTAEQQPLLEYPSAQRAFELFRLGRFASARSEWWHWLSQLSPREKLVATSIAYERGWYDRPIATLSKENYLNDVEKRFPRAFSELITTLAKQRNIAPDWVFAITRRESYFMTDARSSAGAYGLMQIMPNTAKQLLNSKKRVSGHYLVNENNNVRLGTKYLADLLQEQKNPVLATASYNAGPHRIRSWLKYNNQLPADIWIEAIPYKETRNYVKSVLAYQQIYRLQLDPTEANQSPSLFDDLLNMTIGEKKTQKTGKT